MTTYQDHQPRSADRLFELLNSIKGRDKIEILLLFLQEIGGTLQHLDRVGTTWGANGEEVGAAREKKYYLKVVEKIKSLILKEYDEK